MTNLKLAVRMLLKTPLVSLIAIGSLALGIGANTAIFSIFHQMLLRALPVQGPEQIVNLSAPGPKPGSQSSNQAGKTEDVFSYPMFRDLEKVQTMFTGIAAHRLFSANLAARDQTMNGDGLLVSGSYFPLLGVRPALGRTDSRNKPRYVGLIRLFEVGTDRYIQVCNFDREQPGLNKRTSSNYPDPPDVSEVSGNFPETPGNSL